MTTKPAYRRPARSERWILIAALGLLALLPAQPVWAARDAAFLDPGAGDAKSAEAIRVEPKSDVDIGETPTGTARRTTLFFINQSNQPVQITKTDLNSDSNVTAEITADDCQKQGTLTPGSRCSIEVSATPISFGSWSIELLMTHSGAGRIVRAHITGKTAGAAPEKKDTGLALSNKDNKPIEFGTVTVGEGKVVRSALMVNDSPAPITLYSIDIIAADNGLQRLDQGCTVDMELKPGESCPVTMVWTPTDNGQISTDLIIRHSGQLGFAVIPIRGTAQGGNSPAKENNKSSGGASNNNNNNSSASKTPIPPPPAATDLDKAIARLPALDASRLTASDDPDAGRLRLIGTVGTRAVLYKPDGATAVVEAGESIDLGAGHKAKIVSVSGKAAEVMVDGKKEILTLTSVRELTVRAMAVKEAGASSGNKEPVPNSTPSNAHLPSVTSLPMASTPTSGSMSGGGWP